MAYKDLLLYGAKVASVEQVYYSPVAVVPPAITTPLAATYCFLAKVDPWLDENNPPAPTQDQKYIKSVYKNIFAAKLITSSQISPVIQRVDWTSGITYDYYRDDVDMFQQDVNGNNVLNFYVKNHYDQVFKCLWNNNGSPSTVEPFFEPGTYNTNNIYAGSDGYQWKYMYTVDSGQKVRFMDTTWMPVSVGINTPNPLVNSAGAGSIDVINVTNGGSGYDPNFPVTVSIVGDGTGATASATITNGAISGITVTSAGSNYTYATATVSSLSGSGAILQAPTSPIGGHGFDPVSELGCSHVMYTCEFQGNENGVIPTDITYHQIGLLFNPTDKSVSPGPASGSIYKATTDLVVAPGFGVYTNDEVVYQGSSLATATFVGTILSFDSASNIIRVLNTTGSLTTNAPVFGVTSKTTRTLLSYSPPTFVTLSGYMAYIENRTGIQRSADGIEQVKIVLGF